MHPGEISHPTERTYKNIVICSDGTGNTAIKGRGTNVFKIFEAVDLNGHKVDPHLIPQDAIYDDGVGTESFKPLKLLGGAFGLGLARNVRQLYRELVRIYDPGDHIYLFGFSRGAFTVRTLAGMIHACGILDNSKLDTNEALHAAVDKAYNTYRKRYRTALAQFLRPDRPGEVQQALDDFRHANSLPCEVNIRFMGVWDTVDAVGSPLHVSDFINATVHRFKFPDPCLNSSVEKACQALAVDEQRQSFRPVLWANDARIEQVWFSGVHSNVGGGYPKQGVSLVALDWIMQKASEQGLRFIDEDRHLYREHANVDDKLYDSRSGFGMFYRWLPRDIKKLCEEVTVAPTLHLSVLERIAHGTEDYAPGNLWIRPDTAVVFTSTGDSARDQALRTRTRELESTLHELKIPGETLLDTAHAQVIFGCISYYFYIFFVLATVMAIALADAGPHATIRAIATSVWGLIMNAASMQLGALWDKAKLLLQLPKIPELIGAGYIFTYLLAFYVDSNMESAFSQFWHREQKRLRQSLKTSNAKARGHAA